jgi:hypothetical protein
MNDNLPQEEQEFIEYVTSIRQLIDDEFNALFRDSFNVVEISMEESKATKVKELIGKRIGYARREVLKAVETLYPEGCAHVPPLGN